MAVPTGQSPGATARALIAAGVDLDQEVPFTLNPQNTLLPEQPFVRGSLAESAAARNRRLDNQYRHAKLREQSSGMGAGRDINVRSQSFQTLIDNMEAASVEDQADISGSTDESATEKSLDSWRSSLKKLNPMEPTGENWVWDDPKLVDALMMHKRATTVSALPKFLNLTEDRLIDPLNAKIKQDLNLSGDDYDALVHLAGASGGVKDLTLRGYGAVDRMIGGVDVDETIKDEINNLVGREYKGLVGTVDPVTGKEMTLKTIFDDSRVVKDTATLSALSELAETDPTVVERYSGMKPDLIDIATQVESFSGIPEVFDDPRVVADVEDFSTIRDRAAENLSARSRAATAAALERSRVATAAASARDARARAKEVTAAAERQRQQQREGARRRSEEQAQERQRQQQREGARRRAQEQREQAARSRESAKRERQQERAKAASQRAARARNIAAEKKRAGRPSVASSRVAARPKVVRRPPPARRRAPRRAPRRPGGRGR